MNNLKSITPEGIKIVRILESAIKDQPEVYILIEHSIYAGVYTRTAYVPKNVCFTGALVKIPTTLILSGSVVIYSGHGKDCQSYSGYNVVHAEANRKQGFYTNSDLCLTMLFATNAKTVEEAEEEFTDETELLQSRSPNYNNGDNICPVLPPPL